MDKLKFKFFTIEEANSLLPEIKSLLELMKMRKERLVKAIIEMENSRRSIGNNGNRRVFAEKMGDVMKSRDEMAGVHRELLGKGLIVRDYDQGLIDFPTIINGELGYFCWRSNEDVVNHWHLVNEHERKVIGDDIKILRLGDTSNSISDN